MAHANTHALYNMCGTVMRLHVFVCYSHARSNYAIPRVSSWKAVLLICGTTFRAQHMKISVGNNTTYYSLYYYYYY